MEYSGHLWAIILAAGEGKRLRPITRDESGRSIPKQFCAFDGRESMLRWAVNRAARLVPLDRIVPVVATHHRHWWQRELVDLPRENVVEQPANRGTAPGLLLPLTEVLRRDRLATVVVLPSDHHVADESILHRTVLDAFRTVDVHDERVLLLGMVPRESDSEYGWIVPGGTSEPAQPVASFVEKPRPEAAARLMDRGGLLNSMIVVTSGAALLRLYDRALPDLVGRFDEWNAGPRGDSTLEKLYDDLPSWDFSRDVLEGRCEDLWVLKVPGCGWSDLGTVRRLDSYRRSHPAIPHETAARDSA